jgi:hypothetical protein
MNHGLGRLAASQTSRWKRRSAAGEIYEAPMWATFAFLLLGLGSYVFLVRRNMRLDLRSLIQSSHTVTLCSCEHLETWLKPSRARTSAFGCAGLCFRLASSCCFRHLDELPGGHIIDIAINRDSVRHQWMGAYSSNICKDAFF